MSPNVHTIKVDASVDGHFHVNQSSLRGGHYTNYHGLNIGLMGLQLVW